VPDRGSKVLSDRALALEYVHKEDGQTYRHDFLAGVRVTLLPNGTVKLTRPDGRPLWDDFPD